MFGELDFSMLHACARVGAKNYFDLVCLEKFILHFAKPVHAFLHNLPILLITGSCTFIQHYFSLDA